MANQKNKKADNFGLLRGAVPRCLDMSTFLRLQRDGFGFHRLSSALGCSAQTIGQLKKGLHWQQDPEKVKKFNTERGGNVDPETGIPTERDLLKFGYSQAEQMGKVKRTEAAQQVHDVLQTMGHDAASAGRIADHLIAAGDLKKPAHFSTGMVIEGLEDALFFALRLWTPEFLAKAAPRDLSTITAMLIEKRQLLKGEPTVITRSEQRADLAVFAKRLLEECQRRGISLEELQKPAPMLIEHKEPADA